MKLYIQEDCYENEIGFHLIYTDDYLFGNVYRL